MTQPLRVIESELGFKLVFERRNGYLHVAAEGDRDNLEISVAYWKAIAGECRSRGADRILVTEKLGTLDQGFDEDTDAVAFANALAEMGFANTRIAFVDLRREPLRVTLHSEILVREHGLTVRVFTLEDEASLWLRHGEIA
jgi:hypothetical protein